MKRSREGGFTIVETMIVLGVMGVMFVSLVAVVQGQEGKARFRSAVTDLTTQIQSVIGEVSTGYYPKNNGFKCFSASGTVTLTTGGASTLGTNDECTYVGQAVMLGSPATDPEEYYIHTLVGTRKTALGTEPQTLREAGIQVISKGNTYDNSSTWPEFAFTKEQRFGSNVVWMKTRVGSRNIAGFAVVASPSSELTFNHSSQLESGTIVPVILPILHPSADPTFGVDQPTGVDLLIRSLGDVPAGQQLDAEAYAGPIDICVSSGSTQQSALISVGSNNSSTSVDFIIFNSDDCS